MVYDNDTIVAPATAVGGAIAIVRVSGAGAIEICDSIFHSNSKLAQAKGYTAHYGHIMDGVRVVDEVITTLFRAPHSFTGEESVEISCHGSRYIVAEILRLLIGAGARMATPGEFTTRAFLAGKMDLAQAEAVADVIACSSRAAHAVATNQMRGGFSSALADLRTRLLNLASLLELELDFSEEDVEFVDRAELRSTIVDTATQIDTLRRSFSLGNALKEGVAVAIVGEPNVGKSTLLNHLLGEERAMVSDIAGTTRDAIEETTDIDGVLFRFIDTAGIRSTEDRLEQMGIERTHAAIERAKIIVHIADASQTANCNPSCGPDADAVISVDNDCNSNNILSASLPLRLLSLRADQRLIEVRNKIDLAGNMHLPEGVLAISARTGAGVGALRQHLRDCIDLESVYQGDAVVSSARHFGALSSAHDALIEALQSLDQHRPTDLLSEDVRTTLHHLGTITGEITTHEILGNIFSKFCIGK